MAVEQIKSGFTSCFVGKESQVQLRKDVVSRSDQAAEEQVVRTQEGGLGEKLCLLHGHHSLEGSPFILALPKNMAHAEGTFDQES